MLFCIMLNCFIFDSFIFLLSFTWRYRYAQLVCSTNVCCNKFLLKLFGSVDCMLQCLTRQATGIALIILAYKNMEPTPRSLPFGNTNQYLFARPHILFIFSISFSQWMCCGRTFIQGVIGSLSCYLNLYCVHFLDLK